MLRPCARSKGLFTREGYFDLQGDETLGTMSTYKDFMRNLEQTGELTAAAECTRTALPASAEGGEDRLYVIVIE